MCRIFERGGRIHSSTATYVHTLLRCFHGAVGGAGRWGLLYGGRWCDGLGGSRLSALGGSRLSALGSRRFSEAAAAAAGLLLGGTTLDGSPMPPGAWAGRPRRPVCGRKRVRCSASPSTRFTLWGLAKPSRSPQPASRLDFFCSSTCYAWGAAPGGGAAAAAAGAWGVEVYVTASSTHIPTAAAALTCNLQT